MCVTLMTRSPYYHRLAADGDHAKSGNIAIVSWDPYDARKTAEPKNPFPRREGLGEGLPTVAT
jgi:hypothetical protein